jgi:hypothetical protein
MPYNRFYTTFTDENAWQYTLYILPSNANTGSGSASLSSLTSFNLIELPDDFLMRNMTIETELGEIPAGLISQVMNFTINIASLQGNSNLDGLRECLLRGTTQTGFPYNADNTANTMFTFYRFNTFILMVNDGSGDRPVFIGCQKFAAENELIITKLDNVCLLKIECFDALRFIAENIIGDYWAKEFLGIAENANTLDYGSGYSVAMNARYTDIITGTNFYNSPDALEGKISIDSAVDKYNFVVNTFANLKTQIDAMLTQYIKSITWNVSSTFTVPTPFNKAWTFYAPRADYNATYGGVITKPAFVSEIYKIENYASKLLGGALIDSTVFGKFGNFFEVFSGLVENTLEIYRLNLSWSQVTGGFGISYTSDFIRPLTGSGITFDKSNTYSDIKFKLFQETVKSADVSCSTLQAEKDSKTFTYQEGTSSDNGKDIEIMFHNLPSPTNRNDAELNSDALRVYRRNAINAGIIIWNDSGTLKKVDTQCQFKYSNTDAISLDYDVYEIEGGITTQQILEQQQAGVPYTIAKGIVTSLGDSKQVDIEFKSRHSIVGFEDVGTNCTIDLNAINPLITIIYNANTGTGVITKHKLDVFKSSVDIMVRMYG